MVADVTAERRAVEELRRTALHDPLTGLPNRMLLSDRLDLAVARRRRHPESLITMMFIDVDRLKCINDRAGHAVGDAVLVEVAARLRSAVRETDTVARVSGDEFVILCDAASQAEAAAIGQRVKAAFYEDVVVGSDSFRVTVSIGIATSPPGDPDELLRNADAAMYVVKEQSRDGVLLFDPEPGGPLRS
jgi:diguanylate cyclase (GGDEF)-like protein